MSASVAAAAARAKAKEQADAKAKEDAEAKVRGDEELTAQYVKSGIFDYNAYKNDKDTELALQRKQKAAEQAAVRRAKQKMIEDGEQAKYMPDGKTFLYTQYVEAKEAERKQKAEDAANAKKADDERKRLEKEAALEAEKAKMAAEAISGGPAATAQNGVDALMVRASLLGHVRHGAKDTTEQGGRMNEGHFLGVGCWGVERACDG